VLPKIVRFFQEPTCLIATTLSAPNPRKAAQGVRARRRGSALLIMEYEQRGFE